MAIQRPDGHTKGTHSLVAISAALLGVVLGVGVVYWDGANMNLTVQAQGLPADAAGMCPAGKNYQKTRQQDPTNGALNETCFQSTNKGPVSGKCDASGKCNTTDPFASGDKGGMMPMMMMMGGMPPMLPMIPMKMPKMDMPMPMMPSQEDECKRTPKPSHCPNTGISGLLGNIFGTSSAATGSTTGAMNEIRQTVSSLATKLNNFISGSKTETNNPTQAVVTPVVVTGSNAGTVTSNTGGSGGAGVVVGETGATNQAVTGFGSTVSGEVSADTSTGPILSAMTSVIQKIQALLSSIF